MSMQAQVREFHQKFFAPVGGHPQMISIERGELRAELISEELSEYVDALNDRNIVEVADALGDLLYVVLGAAVEHGLDMEPIVAEIHRSNMTKLGADGRPIFRSDGKIMKGPRFELPNLTAEVARQAAEARP